MSMTDGKAHETSSDAASREGDVTEYSGVEAEKDGPGGYIILFFIVGLVASLVVGWGIFPKLLYSKKKIPK